MPLDVGYTRNSGAIQLAKLGHCPIHATPMLSATYTIAKTTEPIEYSTKIRRNLQTDNNCRLRRTQNGTTQLETLPSQPSLHPPGPTSQQPANYKDNRTSQRSGLELPARY